MSVHIETQSQSPSPDTSGARMKVINPIGTMGPSSPALILAFSDDHLRLLVHRIVLVGSTVQVRAGDLVVFGRVCSSTDAEEGFEIEVALQREFDLKS